MIYLSVAILSSFSILFKNRQVSGEIQLIFLCTITLSLILIAGLRYDIGHDFFSYKRIFDYVRPLHEYSGFSDFYLHVSIKHGEWGYYFFNSLIKSMGMNFTGLLIVHASFCFSLLLYSFQKYNANMFHCLLLFILFYSVYYIYSYVRVAMVGAVFLAILPLLHQRKFFSYSLIAIGMGAIHAISFSLVPLIFFRIQLNYFRAAAVILFAFVLNEINPLTILNEILLKLGGFNPFLALNHYLNHFYIHGTISKTQVFHIVLFFINLHFCNKYFTIKHPIYTLMRVHLLGIFISISMLQLTIVAGRVYGLYALVIIIIVPLITKSIKSLALKSLYFGFVAMYGFMVFFKMTYIDQNYLLPYKTVLSPMASGSVN